MSSTLKLLNSDVSTELEAESFSSLGRTYFNKISGKIDSSAASDTYYVHVFDATDVPNNGDALTLLFHPFEVVHVNGVSTRFDIDAGTAVLKASRGLGWYISTTEFTKTVATSGVASATILFSPTA